MPIHRSSNGFWESEDLASTPSLGIESDKLNDCIQYYHEKQFESLFGSPCFGFEEQDLNFLRHTPNAKKLWFWDVKLDNIDAIYGLHELKDVGIHPHRPGMTIHVFQN